MLVIQEKKMYVTRHEDEIVGPFESYEAAHAWLLSLSGGRGDQAYAERLSDPVKTKALWAGWDAETDATLKLEAERIEASVTLASENGND